MRSMRSSPTLLAHYSLSAMTVWRLGSKPGNISLHLRDRADTDWNEWPVDFRISEFSETTRPCVDWARFVTNGASSHGWTRNGLDGRIGAMKTSSRRQS